MTHSFYLYNAWNSSQDNEAAYYMKTVADILESGVKELP